MAREEVIVQKSGNLYVLGNRRQAVAVDLDEGTTSAMVDTQSFLAHCHVNDPWEVVADHGQLPEQVRKAIEAFHGRGG